MSLKKGKKNILLGGLVILLIVLEPRSYINIFKSSNNLSNVVLLTCLCASFFLVNIIMKRKYNFNYKKMLILLFLISIIYFNKIVMDDSSGFSIYFSIVLFVGFIFTELIPLDKFIKIFIKVFSFLCVYSIITTYIVIFFSDFFSGILPTYFLDIKNMNFLDCIFTFVYIPEYGIQYRNYSIFSEPGVFQIFINIALILELFFKKNNEVNRKRVLIFLIALISTFSTAGIICGIGVMGNYMLWKSGNKDVKKYTLKALVFLIIIGFIVISFNEEISKTFGGMIGKFSGDESVLSRMGSLWAYLEAWLNKPVFGWGYEGGTYEVGRLFLSQYTEHNTNTIFTNLTIYGVFYGGTYLILLFKFNWKSQGTRRVKFNNYIIILLLISSQNMIDSRILIILLFYSIDNLNKEKMNKSIGI